MASLIPERMSSGFFGPDPFGTFEAMRNLIDPPAGTAPPAGFAGFDPPVNLSERDGAYLLECTVPGFGQDDIKVDARADRVTIAGAVRRDPRYVSFMRTVMLPQAIDPDLVAAKLENDLLTIVLRPAHRSAEATGAID